MMRTMATALLFVTTLAATRCAPATPCPVCPSLALPPEPEGPIERWSADVMAHRGRINLSVSYDCPGPGTVGSVWGSGIYTDDSSVCTAAVHAGLISLERGGRVTIRIVPGRAHYAGSQQNGIHSQDYQEWPSSFVFVSGGPIDDAPDAVPRPFSETP